MAKHIQIRNVPDELHRTLRTRAAAAGLSLSEYLLRELEDLASRPAVHETLERAASRTGGRLPLRTAGKLVRRDRDARS